jgi:hypothetical protein
MATARARFAEAVDLVQQQHQEACQVVRQQHEAELIRVRAHNEEVMPQVSTAVTLLQLTCIFRRPCDTCQCNFWLRNGLVGFLARGSTHRRPASRAALCISVLKRVLDRCCCSVCCGDTYVLPMMCAVI